MINKPINVEASVLITYQFYQFTIKYNLQQKVKVKRYTSNKSGYSVLMIFSYFMHLKSEPLLYIYKFKPI